MYESSFSIKHSFITCRLYDILFRFSIFFPPVCCPIIFICSFYIMDKVNPIAEESISNNLNKIWGELETDIDCCSARMVARKMIIGGGSVGG